GLAGAFPTTRDRFFLAYAESVSAVDRIVRSNGRDSLVTLIRSYANGVSDDEAFQSAIGRDLAGFEKDWLGELGATAPSRVGPQPAAAGPLPPGWEGPRPNPSFEVVGSLPPPRPGAPRGNDLRDDPVAVLLAPSIGLIGIVVLVVVGIAAYRRTRRSRVAANDAAWNQLYARPIRHDDEPGDDLPDPRDDRSEEGRP
ncbi:MAG TPA: hypothetical protein VGO64_11895, partial [Candidatus Limnocylindrales bacterium]|nr:hypothetical protein [Candidatus Limnocylindrales bacterium]